MPSSDSARIHSLAFGALAAGALALLVAAAPAAACSVCMAGDPQFSTQGASALAEGDLSLFVQLQAFEKTAGVEGGGTESAQDQRLDLFAAWSPRDRVTLTLDLPFSFNEIHEGGERFSANGLGDVSLAASVVAWRDRELLPTAWLEARAFMKAPTGDSTRSAGGEVDAHLQPGTGAWDFGFGVAGARRFERAVLYASAFYRANGRGELDPGHHYAYGDALLVNAALELPLGHALGRPALDALTLGAELNYRWAARDREDGARFVHSGGSVLYATPSLRVRLPVHLRERPVALRAAVQIPLTSAWLHGFQREDEVWSIGLFLPL